MANYNRVILAGNLTRDPQMSYLPSNTPVVEFGLAVNRRWRGQDGQLKEETCFVDCRAYARQAETINQHVSKGRPLLVEGRLQFQQWTSQDGGKRSKHIVIVDQFQFMDSRRGDDFGGGQPARAPQAQEQGQGQGQAPSGGYDAAPAMPENKDIPF
jgi:single-strand DNA-binding protein